MAFARWDIDVSFGIEYDSVANTDSPGIWGGESGDAVEQSGLASSRCAEKDGDARGEGEVGLKRKSRERLADMNVKRS